MCPCFVATESEAGCVVSFDEDARDCIDATVDRVGDRGTESRRFFEWCAEAREFDARQFCDAVKDGLSVHCFISMRGWATIRWLSVHSR